MKKAAFLTLGCRVNQYETQCIREGLLSLGFEEATVDDPCDLYVLNTCAVTGESVRKGKQLLRRVLRKKKENPETVVCLCGCFPQGEKEALELFREVDVLAGNTRKGELASILAACCNTPAAQRIKLDLREDISRPRPYEPMRLCRSHNARAFVKIQDGCNSFCTYCYVPLVRGRVRSREAEDIFSEVERLQKNGYEEVVLTGIETGAWGTDFQSPASLCDLVEELSERCGIRRIRFGSLKPMLFDDAFCKRLSSIPSVLPHFHLSLQSGSSRILSLMGRKYDRTAEEEAIANIYRYFPDAGLSADVICGFPGETEEDFADSVSLVQQANLLHTHIFPFSPREGTRAALMEQTVSPEEKKKRCADLLKIAKESGTRFSEDRVGKRYRVLCERIRDGFMLGYTENFIYTRTPVPKDVQVGNCYDVTLTDERTFSVETMIVSGELTRNG